MAQDTFKCLDVSSIHLILQFRITQTITTLCSFILRVCHQNNYKYKFKFCSIILTLLVQNIQMEDRASMRLFLGMTFAQSFSLFYLTYLLTKLRDRSGKGGGENIGNPHQNFQGVVIALIDSFFMTMPILINIKVICAWIRISSVVGMAQDSSKALLQMYSHSMQ